MDLRSLKSGSDIRGIAAGESAVLTPSLVRRFAAAFAGYLSRQEQIPIQDVAVAVGRDSRITGPALLSAACEGIAAAGAKAFDCGLCTTPSMYMAILEPDFMPAGSIMITASHHPWNINGMKFFTRRGGIGYSDLDEILGIAERGEPEAAAQENSAGTYPLITAYRKHLEAMIRKGVQTNDASPLRGLHVVVDAGNGAGGFYADMLAALGAQVDGSQYLDPNGMFPNHPPNPENPEAMASVSAAVEKAGADLGVIFDTDCDRAAIVDSNGKEINRNRLIALISAVLLAKHPGGTIVTDSVTSSGLSSFICEAGGVHYRYKRGYRNVIDEAMRLNQAGVDCPLAIETSGHAAMRENHFLDDGMYLVTYLIIQAMRMKKQGKSLSTLIESLQEPIESAEYRIRILAADFKKAGTSVIQSVLDEAARQAHWRIAPDNREGIRIHFDLQGGTDKGWFLLRMSVHDPLMVLNIESDVPGGNRTMLLSLYEALKASADIDLTAIENTLQSAR